ncbi:MAG: hypothetical protein ACXVRK_00930 [Gaiellaceae bacterium]
MQTKLLRPVQAVLMSAALLVVAALALAACGSGTGTADPSATPSATPSGGASSFAAYTACLRNHWVKLPSFGGTGNGGTPPINPPTNPPSGSLPSNGGGGFGRNLTPAQRKTFQAAQMACASLRPQGGFFGRGAGGGAP